MIKNDNTTKVVDFYSEHSTKPWAFFIIQLLDERRIAHTI